ncbi:unnamed protein product [Clonostachys rhizophaga]|uniref:AAA+ ATPase domain-containing protein n=1 Tax=Clonostachys rhizophaga TaxID=160324 RepID=A0A9N9VWD4_9HYPO|nr:unnamed protein product [Clonostachys rhizophaga]
MTADAIEKKPTDATNSATDVVEAAASGNENETNKSDDAQGSPDTPVGCSTVSTVLFATFDKAGRQSWSSKSPDVETTENKETRKSAIIVRKVAPKRADSSKPLVIDSLVIQSPYLKKVLAKVLEDYPGIVVNVVRLVFENPFECFVHRWDRFIQALEDPELDDLTKDHLKLLHEILEEELRDVLQAREDFIKTRAVNWAYVWTIFTPGCIVWGSKNGKPIAVRFVRGEYAKDKCGKFYALHCQCIEWDGKILGWAKATQKIRQYLGTMKVQSLSCFPLDMHSQKESVTQLLRERGLRFHEFAGHRYKFSNGLALWYDRKYKIIRQEMVDSRIVIDAKTWAQETPELSFTTTKNLRLGGYVKGTVGGRRPDGNDDGSESESDESGEEGSEDESDDGMDVDMGTGVDDDFDPKNRGKDGRDQNLPKHLLILTSPMVRGYSLKNRRWMEFFIDDVSEITFRENSFDSLVLEQEKKDLILAFSQTQIKRKDQFDDVISGKGRGIIMLLSGSPGIGKTLTAETVAEHMRVPLYSIHASDLGSYAWEMQHNMSKILTMVASWNAVLLLDECDVYLEKRETGDVSRNSIVSVFLRMLEYYEGILFMTTNRVDTIDPAFESRIHLSLEYPNLTDASREQVWRAFFEPIDGQGDKAHELSDADIKELSKLDLNGRQIKNTIKMAKLLSWQREESLKMWHVKYVLKVQKLKNLSD